MIQYFPRDCLRTLVPRGFSLDYSYIFRHFPLNNPPNNKGHHCGSISPKFVRQRQRLSKNISSTSFGLLLCTRHSLCGTCVPNFALFAKCH